MPILDMFLATLVAAIWGGNFVSAKFGLGHFPPLLLTSLRFVVVGALLLPFAPRPNNAQLRRIFLLAFVLGTLHFAFLFASLYHGLTIAGSTIVGQMGVPFACLLGVVLYRDKVGIYRIMGMAVAFIGIAIVAGTPNILSHPLGFFIALTAAFCWAVANILMKRLDDLPIFHFLAWFSVCAIPQLWLLSAIFERDQLALLASITPSAAASVAYTALVSTMVGYGLWYRLIRTHPVTQVAPFSLLVPVFGVAFGQLFFDEPLSAQMLIGGAIAIVGVAIIVIRRPKLLEMGKLT